MLTRRLLTQRLLARDALTRGLLARGVLAWRLLDRHRWLAGAGSARRRLAHALLARRGAATRSGAIARCPNGPYRTRPRRTCARLPHGLTHDGLAGTGLTSATLTGTGLTRTRLTGATLTGAGLTRCLRTGSRLAGALPGEGTALRLPGPGDSSGATSRRAGRRLTCAGDLPGGADDS